jgi:hypothetical protein
VAQGVGPEFKPQYCKKKEGRQGGGGEKEDTSLDCIVLHIPYRLGTPYNHIHNLQPTCKVDDII